MQANNRNQTNFFAEESTINIQRSVWRQNFNHKTTFNTGQIIPFYVDSDIMPGQTIKNKTAVLIRMSTPIYPTMDNLFLDTYYFKVPHWTLWENWKAFNGENEMGAWANTTEYETPIYTTTTGNTVQIGDIANYMGVPPGIAGLSFQQIPIRAYFRVYNFWFRDQNLIAPIQYNTGDANVNYQNMAGGKKPLKAARFHDYFSACLPEPQKGTAVSTPLGVSAPVSVYGNGNALGLNTTANNNIHVLADLTSDNNYIAGSPQLYTSPVPLGTTIDGGTTSAGFVNNLPIGVSINKSLSGLIGTADLTQATAATINALRLAFATQRILEKQARFGTRYNEIIRGIWGVTSPNASLHVPEYLGGKRIPINIETVLQNSATNSESPLGETGAFSVSFDVNHDFTKSFDEHCVIIGLAVVRAQHTYQQGLARMWTRRRLLDYYQPSLAHIGNQPVYNYEIYAQGNSTDNQVFGYKEAWAEYKFRPNRISGELMSQFPQSLDAWHYADDYSSLPVLSQNWLEETDELVGRTLATTNTSAQFIADFEIEQTVAAPMPIHCTPGLIDHF